ncbi:calcium-dependent protein kinase [Mactra antiquata]
MAKKYEDDHIPEEFIQELQELFSQYDRNNDGTVDMRDVMKSLGKDISPEEMEEALHILCNNEDGKMVFEDFKTLLLKKMKDIDGTDDCKEMFTSLDRYDSGYFTPEELRKAMLSYGETISLFEATELINSIETKEKGRIDYDEFCQLVKVIIRKH